jgi:hypothetical protein
MSQSNFSHCRGHERSLLESREHSLLSLADDGVGATLFPRLMGQSHARFLDQDMLNFCPAFARERQTGNTGPDRPLSERAMKGSAGCCAEVGEPILGLGRAKCLLPHAQKAQSTGRKSRPRSVRVPS